MLLSCAASFGALDGALFFVEVCAPVSFCSPLSGARCHLLHSVLGTIAIGGMKKHRSPR
jgi:hypothetical protein